MNISDNLLSSFNEDLQQLLFEVVGKEINISKKWQAHAVRRALAVKKYETFIRFNTPVKRCAYLLKYGPCITSVVAKYLIDIVQANSEIIQQALSKGKLSICCLGGGPALEVVAIIRIIRDLYQIYFQRTQRALEVIVLIIDSNTDWNVTASNIFQLLVNAQKLVGTNELIISYQFYSVDFSTGTNSEIQQTIQNADIITMVYFLSAMSGIGSKDQSHFWVENIMLNMNRGALLFFLDSANDCHYCQVLNDVATKHKNVLEIYGPFAEEFHTLTLGSVKKFIDLYSNYFYRFLCMTNVFVCVSSWYKPVKVSQSKVIRKMIFNNTSPWIIPTDEDRELMTKRRKEYQKSVQKLLDMRLSVSKPSKNVEKLTKYPEDHQHFHNDSQRNKNNNSSVLYRYTSSPKIQNDLIFYRKRINKINSP